MKLQKFVGLILSVITLSACGSIKPTKPITDLAFAKTSETIGIGETLKLEPLYDPIDADDYSFTWTSSKPNYVAVTDDGLIRGVNEGTAVITLLDEVSTLRTKITINCKKISVSSISVSPKNTTLEIGKTLQIITTISPTNATNQSIKYSITSGQGLVSVSNTGMVTALASGTAVIKVESVDRSAVYANCTITIPEIPVEPTGLSFSTTSGHIEQGKNMQLTANYIPSNANVHKDINWTSSNSTYVSVDDNGYVRVDADAPVGTKATITASLDYYPNIKATYNVTVDEKVTAYATVLIYMCGSNLESGGGYASSDLKEIKAAVGQPDDVNIVIETGGSTYWNTTGISANKIGRWHIENKQLVKDEELSQASMGNSATLQSFLTWGLTKYPATNVGLIFWNHGGAMQGVCSDDNYGGATLDNNEVRTAIRNARTATGWTEKFKFVGYDACLMQVQDIAEFNSEYFEYMIGAEESEGANGWYYTNWVNYLYNKKSWNDIFSKMVSDYIAKASYSNETLSCLDLSLMSEYKSTFEDMATALETKIASAGSSGFKKLMNSVKHFAGSDYTSFGTFDVLDFCSKLSSNSSYNPGGTYVSDVVNAASNMIIYSGKKSGAGNANGLALFFPISSSCYKNYYYTNSMTNFTNWRSICVKYGS